ncbi:alpha/beta fold hydrolase [Roseateles sp.]|uniref:alpha/beta fold hydrolase n=1 Tax=Roseateles sp. TaxID=1971397 RepID=UPI002E02E43B|nr:alpha/beta fold hydrolase [Roseateles sp.]
MPHATPVVCLHSSASSGRQWRRLAATGAAWRWHTPDLYGHGQRPDWPELMPNRLEVEAQGVLAGLPLDAGLAFHLVGHSYGGAVALQLALLQPARVLSLTLYEPVAFGLLPGPETGDAASVEIAEVARALTLALARADDFGAARGFCAYWQGRDIWPELQVDQQLRMADAMPTVKRHFDALFAARWMPAQLAGLDIPVRLLCGTATRASARAVAARLAECLPRASLQMLEGADHMAPIGEAARVNALILGSLERLQRLVAA